MAHLPLRLSQEEREVTTEYRRKSVKSQLNFRNVEASPEDPIETWPIEGIEIALDRGSLHYWRKLALAVQGDPWGPVARRVEHVLSYGRPYGIAPAMEQVIADARNASQIAERAAVRKEIGMLVDKSGLVGTEFAERIGTSPSRLSTYLSGKVVPSAAVMERMRNITDLVAKASS